MNRSSKNSARISKERTKRGGAAGKIALLLILVCALLFVGWEIFKVRNIKVAGCVNLNADHVIALSGLQYESSVFEVDRQKIEAALAADPYIKPDGISVRYPDCVEIKIKERAETACIRKNGQLLIIDDECWLLRIIADTGTAPYTLVSGLNLDELTVGERLGDKDIYRLDVLSAVLKAANENGVAIESVDMSLAADVVIKTSEGYTAELGDETKLKEKFDLYKSAAAEMKALGKTGSIIDVASAQKAYCR